MFNLSISVYIYILINTEMHVGKKYFNNYNLVYNVWFMFQNSFWNLWNEDESGAGNNTKPVWSLRNWLPWQPCCKQTHTWRHVNEGFKQWSQFSFDQMILFIIHFRQNRLWENCNASKMRSFFFFKSLSMITMAALLESSHNVCLCLCMLIPLAHLHTHIFSSSSSLAWTVALLWQWRTV